MIPKSVSFTEQANEFKKVFGGMNSKEVTDTSQYIMQLR